MKEIFTVPEKLKDMLDLLEEQQVELAAAVRAGREQNKGEKNKFIDPKLSMALKDLATGYSTLAREYRNWLGHMKTSLDRLSVGRKIQVMVQFVQDLPLGNRRDVYQVLAKLEAERADRIDLVVSDRFAQPEVTRERDAD